MKILFIQKRYHSNQHFAVKGLLERGHHVAYFVQEVGPSENYEVLLPKKIPYSTMFLILERFIRSVFKYKISRSNFGFPSLSMYREIKSYDPDVLIIKRCRAYSQAARLVSIFLRKPVIVYDQNRMVDERKKRGIVRTLCRWLLRPRVGFTPASGIVKGEIPSKIGSTYYIPLVCEPSTFERLRAYKRDGCLKILAVGKYQDMRKKRHDLLMQAVHTLVRAGYDLTLTFVGSGHLQDQRLQYLKTFSEQLELANRVTFQLNIPHDQMSKFYASHDVFVLPSRREGYGYSVLEAMSNGLPVIASNRNGSSDCIENGVNGYIFESDNLESLTGAIENIVKDHVQLERMGEASREIVRQRYSPHVYHDRLMRLLEAEFGLKDVPSGSQASPLAATADPKHNLL